MAVTNFASADTISGISMDFVTIGHAGNAADTGGTVGRGAVSYNYRIGKYEITNAQWNAFTSAAGTPTGNPSEAYSTNTFWTGTQQPTNNVSWYEAAQFCNYLTSGNKSLGAYQLGANGSITVDRASAISTYGTIYVIPTEDEWYKAAFFKPNASGYSFYANGTNTKPIAGVQSNYNSNSPWNIGSGTIEQNGTFDMMGNVWEWNENIVYSSFRGERGGSYGDGQNGNSCMSSWVLGTFPANDSIDMGFRIASVPEPATILLLGLGAAMLRRKR